MSRENDVVAAIEKRKSVRSYDGRPLSAEDLATVRALMDGANNPFGEKVKLHLLEDVAAAGVGKCGTARDARSVLGVSAPITELSPLAIGYQFESLILGATACGLSTVWMATGFKRAKFEKAMGVHGDQWLAVIAPVGYAAARLGSAEVITRKLLRADEREMWRDIFTEDGFQIQLTEEQAGDYAQPLEMLRWAPSARNGQPWRIVKKENVFYFYETHKSSLSDQEKRLKQIELGAAIAHFHLTAQSLGLKGHFDRKPLRDVHIPENTFYHISWVMDE